MKLILLLFLSTFTQLFSQELSLFAPAVKFSNVLWMGPSTNGLMTWYAGKNFSVYPADLGEIKVGRINKSQEIFWRGRDYQIDSIKRVDSGALEIRFDKFLLIMTRTIDGFFTFDVISVKTLEPSMRFRTTVKSTEHDAFVIPETRAESKLHIFAPAVEFKQVTWWGLNANNISSWFAGIDGTPTPADLGKIHEGRIIGSQQMTWINRVYDIQSVTKTDTGAFEIVFGAGKLQMLRTADGFYIVDVFPGESKQAVERFKTSRKATAHD